MSNESRITVQNEGDILILEIQETRISEGLVIEALSSELEVILQDRQKSSTGFASSRTDVEWHAERAGEALS